MILRFDKKKGNCKMRETIFTIRKSELKDIPDMLEIFAAAVQTMRNNGNLEQWINYPPDGLLEKDIRAGKSYVLEANGKIAGRKLLMAISRKLEQTGSISNPQ